MGLKLITEPSVYVVGRQELVSDEIERFLSDEGFDGWESSTSVPGQVLCEAGGRLCYASFGKGRPGGNAAYIRRILEQKHGSVLEHAVFTLILTGISRSCSHELVRHRVGLSPSQLSQRYVDESDVAFVVPPALMESYDAWHESMRWTGEMGDVPNSILGGASEWERWTDGRKANVAEYRRLVNDLTAGNAGRFDDPTEARKAAREAARSVLPNCTETKIQITANARALRHFFDLRAKPGADAEIRRLALAAHATLVNEAPNLFGDYESATTDDGIEYLTTAYPGV